MSHSLCVGTDCNLQYCGEILERIRDVVGDILCQHSSAYSHLYVALAIEVA